jgi:hypothetical protein
MKRAVAAALVVNLGAAAGSAMAADTPPAPVSPFRYDDDPTVYAEAPADDLYARFNYVSIGPEDYLSLGADLRERVEASDVGLLGLRNPGADAYDLHRLLVFADLQLGPDIRGSSNSVSTRKWDEPQRRSLPISTSSTFRRDSSTRPPTLRAAGPPCASAARR